jgi:hypothetical protein
MYGLHAPCFKVGGFFSIQTKAVPQRTILLVSQSLRLKVTVAR